MVFWRCTFCFRGGNAQFESKIIEYEKNCSFAHVSSGGAMTAERNGLIWGYSLLVSALQRESRTQTLRLGVGGWDMLLDLNDLYTNIGNRR